MSLICVWNYPNKLIDQMTNESRLPVLGLL